MEPQHHLTTDQGVPFADPGQYKWLIKCLIYLTITRLELSYSSHILSQFMRDPHQPHWDATVRVERYVKHCPDKEFIFAPLHWSYLLTAILIEPAVL